MDRPNIILDNLTPPGKPKPMSVVMPGAVGAKSTLSGCWRAATGMLVLSPQLAATIRSDLGCRLCANLPIDSARCISEPSST